MGRGKLEMKKFGKVKVKNMIPVKKRLRGHMPLEEIPDDCGYDKQFKFDIDMHSNGIMGDCIEWCQTNCKHKTKRLQKICLFVASFLFRDRVNIKRQQKNVKFHFLVFSPYLFKKDFGHSSSRDIITSLYLANLH